MYTNIIGTQQILITAAFLGVMVLLLIILRKKSTVIRANMRAGKRINIIEDKDVEQLVKGLSKDQVQYLLGTPLLNSPIQDTGGGLIVGVHLSRWLRMSHFNQTLSDWERFLGIQVQGSNLSLSS